MLRVVVAASLAVSLLAVSLPAVETARHDHSEQRIAAELDGVAAAIRDVHAREAGVSANEAGARRVVTVRLPPRTWTDAGVEYVAIGAHPDRPAVEVRNQTTFVWQVSGSQPRTRRLSGVSVEAGPVNGNDEPLVIREPGAQRLAVSLTERDGKRVVVVRRAD